jgi:ribose-phosphate pyrophosphokinase
MPPLGPIEATVPIAARTPMKLFAGTAHRELAQGIADWLGIELGALTITRFPDSEMYVKFEESVRGTECFIVQPTCFPIDTNLLELLILIDALKRASAESITCVMPYYGYARQERKAAPREAITAKLIADLLSTAGINRLVAMDLHADAIQGFFNIPVDHLTGVGIIADYLEEEGLKDRDDVVLVSPDEGRVKTVRSIASRLHAPLAVGYKVRDADGKAENAGLAGDVRNKKCIVYDDIISTGGSIMEIVDALLLNGARPEITIACTHAVFAGKAVERLNRPEIAEIIVTDTIPIPPEKRSPKTRVLSIAPLFAEAIQRIWTDESVSSLFDD